ncbi:MAG: glycosyltransferase family 2 protein, partial [Verrucomicrobia bacterium]|nr:glycosyltransferase family 2 protein [Verrucomicrobiota bacterium]
MLKYVNFLFFMLLAVCRLQAADIEKPIVIIIPSYNNEGWYNSNLNSVLSQSYSNYRIIYINDCSSDKTGEYVELMVKKFTDDYQVVDFEESADGSILASSEIFTAAVNKKKCFFTLVNNIKRQGALANLYRAIYSCLDDEIMVLVDGDDWLLNYNVLKGINELYRSENVWLTHGQFIEYPKGGTGWNLKITKDVVRKNKFRQYRAPSHLRTFYSWLFKRIKLSDLLYNGDFFPMTWDMAIMIPMIEMAAERHAYSPTLNYVYNMSNPINDDKVNAKLQNDLDAYIRAMPPY